MPARRASAGSASGSTRCLRASARISNSRASASSSRAGSKASASRGAVERVLGLGRLDHRPVERRQRLGQQVMLAGDPVEPPRRLAELGEAALRALQQRRDRRRARRRAARRPAWSARRPASASSSPGSGASRSSSSTAWSSHSRSRSASSCARAGLGERCLGRAQRAARPRRPARCRCRPKASSRARWPRGFSRPRSSCWPWISTSSAPSSRSRPAETGWSLTKARLPPSALTMRRMTSGSPRLAGQAVLVEQRRARDGRPRSSKATLTDACAWPRADQAAVGARCRARGRARRAGSTCRPRSRRSARRGPARTRGRASRSARRRGSRGRSAWTSPSCQARRLQAVIAAATAVSAPACGWGDGAAVRPSAAGAWRWTSS